VAYEYYVKEGERGTAVAALRCFRLFRFLYIMAEAFDNDRKWFTIPKPQKG